MTKKPLKISPVIIWTSSIFLGVLSSVPHIAQHHFNAGEAAVNAGITALFALLMWYLNIFMLSRKSSGGANQGISYSKLFKTLLIGIVVMLFLAYLQQLILSHINFGPVMLMVEVRGILINLIFYMFLHLIQQNYENQQVNMELEKIKHDSLGAQYEMLKQQVNPHFLFNSLNTLKAMVETADKDSVDFILKLSNFYRFTLESRKLDLIHLSEEMEIVNAYLFLQKARFDGGFTFTSHLSPEHLQTLVPPFTLQLLIENCIKHNVVSLGAPLHITLHAQDDALVLENPIRLKKVEHNSLGVGLKNIALRYEHLIEKPIVISEENNIFKIKLPLIYEHRHN